MRKLVAGLVGCLAVLVARPAFANFHIMQITEVFPGTTGAPNAQYIELQMYTGGQNVLGGHTLTVFDAAGTSVMTYTFAANVGNGTDQATVLIATTQAATLFAVTPDLLMTPTLPLAGGKVFTMLDIGYVYMDIYLPTATAGQVKIGTDARIVLDAYPDLPIPAKVTFLASQAQFTPKMVETQTERDKLMFRIRVRIDPERSRAHADAVRTGLPGVADVRFDAKTDWPERLQGNP